MELYTRCLGPIVQGMGYDRPPQLVAPAGCTMLVVPQYSLDALARLVAHTSTDADDAAKEAAHTVFEKTACEMIEDHRTWLRTSNAHHVRPSTYLRYGGPAMAEYSEALDSRKRRRKHTNDFQVAFAPAVALDVGRAPHAPAAAPFSFFQPVPHQQPAAEAGTSKPGGTPGGSRGVSPASLTLATAMDGAAAPPLPRPPTPSQHDGPGARRHMVKKGVIDGEAITRVGFNGPGATEVSDAKVIAALWPDVCVEVAIARDRCAYRMCTNESHWHLGTQRIGVHARPPDDFSERVANGEFKPTGSLVP